MPKFDDCEYVLTNQGMRCSFGGHYACGDSKKKAYQNLKEYLKEKQLEDLTNKEPKTK